MLVIVFASVKFQVFWHRSDYHILKQGEGTGLDARKLLVRYGGWVRERCSLLELEGANAGPGDR